mmetsp:Transcript_15086/g.19717  ORF Transcript_15086/g.19717 Transcript_15086/m.19717 type:complete len:102 (-) Transcript_15086:285-590(-)
MMRIIPRSKAIKPVVARLARSAQGSRKVHTYNSNRTSFVDEIAHTSMKEKMIQSNPTSGPLMLYLASLSGFGVGLAAYTEFDQYNPLDPNDPCEIVSEFVY